MTWSLPAGMPPVGAPYSVIQTGISATPALVKQSRIDCRPALASTPGLRHGPLSLARFGYVYRCSPTPSTPLVAPERTTAVRKSCGVIPPLSASVTDKPPIKILAAGFDFRTLAAVSARTFA